MNWLDGFTRVFAEGFRAVGSRYPTLIAVSISTGFILKIVIHAISQVGKYPIAESMDGFDWYVYAAIANGLFLLPTVFGKSRVPDIVLEQIAAMKKIMDEANMSSHNRSLFWTNFLGKFIRETTISTTVPAPYRSVDHDRETASRTEGTAEE